MYDLTQSAHHTIDYPAMIDSAMRGVVRQALLQIAHHGLPGEHHFYVSFSTGYPGVRVSPQLRDRFPQDMTIVVQHQFWDLEVAEDFFSITLSFNNIPEKLVVPYAALTAFADPSIKFGLQFHTRLPKSGVPAMQPPAEASFDDAPVITQPEADDAAAGTKVLSLDAFRKK